MVAEARLAMKHARLYAAPFFGLPLLLPTSLAASAPRTAKPPSSIEPEGKAEPVRVSHRHRTIVECMSVPLRTACAGRIGEGDTAAVVRFERSGVTAALDPAQRAISVVFPHRSGPQEQTIGLPIGEWLVDWPGSDKLERLEIKPGARMLVALATTSGACELKTDSCELVPGVRERRIRVSEAR
jgi:hypothetical protein